MKIKNLILALMTLFTVVGCIKDKGNYEYPVLPEYSISVARPTDIIVGDKAVFEVKVKFPEGVHYDVEYQWRLDEVEVPGATNPKFEFIATEVGINQVGVTVTEKITGHKKYAYSDVTVGSLFESGFLLLVEDGGNTDMHFVRSILRRQTSEVNDSLIFVSEHTNIYKNSLGGAIEGTPVSLQEHWTWEADIPGEISVETKVNGKSKFSEYSGTTLTRETLVEQEFSGGALPANFDPQKMLYSAWDTFILDKNGSAYARRSSASDGFHTGLFDKNVTLWGDTKFTDMFTCYYPTSRTFLAIEIDPITQQRNFVGILENRGYSGGSIIETTSGTRLPQVPVRAEYTNFKGQVLFSDYFKMPNDWSDPDKGIQSFIIKNENNELILQVVHTRVVSEISIDLFKTSKLNLAQHSISKVNGMFTSKTVYDRVIYVYDDSNIYSFVYNVNEGVFIFNKMLEFSGKTIASASNQSLGRYRYTDPERNINQAEAHIGVAFTDGTFEIYELDNVNPDIVTEKVYQNKENFGKIKQVIFKAGSDLRFAI